MKTNFEFCSVCGKKIGWFRKLLGDNSEMGMIPTNQFCSNKCHKEGLNILLTQINKQKKKKKEEKQK